jgi:DNA repair protein RadA/Sms
MEDKGLNSLKNPEKVFLEEQKQVVPGSVVTALMEGTRPILVEIQSLVVPTKLAIPRRVAQGIDSRRLEMLLAVLTRRCGISLYDFDVFVNVAGGIKVSDTSCDLAVCLSLASAYKNKPINKNIIAVGEVGLLGEIRKVKFLEKRVKEAKRLGYKTILSGDSFDNLNQAIKKTFDR